MVFSSQLPIYSKSFLAVVTNNMTLTELSYQLRKILPFFILLILIFLIIFYSFKLFFIYIEANRPKASIVPTLFGKIAPPDIEDATSSANFSYILDTVEGHPVTSTDSAKVYFMPKPTTRFGYREKIYLMAKTLGFDTDRVKHKLTDDMASFEDEDRLLSVNVANFNFEYDSKPDPTKLASGNAFIPSRKEIENKATDFLRKVGRYPEELLRGATNVIYLTYSAGLGTYVNVESKSEANLVEVDFYRPDIDGISTVTPRFFNSPNYVILLFNEDGYEVVKAQISFFERSETQVDLYPVKSADLAWEEFVNGKAKVVAATKGAKKILIKKIFLSYYDPNIYQSFFQPVYVFLGDNDFVGYLPAVPDQFLIEQADFMAKRHSNPPTQSEKNLKEADGGWRMVVGRRSQVAGDRR